MNQYVEFIDLENSAPLQGMPTANEDRKGGNSEGKGQESSVVSDVANLFGDGSFQDNNATSQSHASIFAENQGTNIDFGTGFQAINEIERKNSGSFVDSSSDNSWNIKTENVSSSSSTSSNSLTDLDPLHPQTNINMTSNHTSFSSSSSDQSHNINHLDESLSILDGDDLLSNGSFIDRIALESFGADHGSQQVPSQYYGEAAYQYAYDQNGELVTVPVRPTYYNTIPTYQQYSTNLTYTKTKKPKAKKASKSKVKRTSSHDGHDAMRVFLVTLLALTYVTAFRPRFTNGISKSIFVNAATSSDQGANEMLEKNRNDLWKEISSLEKEAMDILVKPHSTIDEKDKKRVEAYKLLSKSVGLKRNDSFMMLANSYADALQNGELKRAEKILKEMDEVG